jgi:hypothetical protein
MGYMVEALGGGQLAEGAVANDMIGNTVSYGPTLSLLTPTKFTYSTTKHASMYLHNCELHVCDRLPYGQHPLVPIISLR